MKETNLFIIKFMAGMAQWERANGHDDLAIRLERLLGAVVAHEGTGDTILEDHYDLADAICQEYQDHITEFYADPLHQMVERFKVPIKPNGELDYEAVPVTDREAARIRAGLRR